MEKKESMVAAIHEGDASNASRRQIGAALLGVFGGAMLSGCANATEQETAPISFGETEQLLSGTNLVWFDTIAGAAPALKTVVGAANRQLAVAEGYWAAGDGGGGLFYWDATSTATDNQGTIIQVTGTPTGRWRRIYDGALSVKWFGAKGDGTTNDPVAIQKCIDDVALVGGEVWLPPTAAGYRVTATVTLKRNVSLRGSRRSMGRGQKIFATSATANSFNIGSLIKVDHTGVCIDLEADTCVDGLEFWYPQQVWTGTPVVHDWTLRAVIKHGVTIRNVLATNPYRFIYLSVDGGLIENVQGWPLSVGVHLGRCGDVVRLSKVHFNPNALPNAHSTLVAWCANNGVAFKVDGAEGFQFEQIHALGYLMGLQLLDGGHPAPFAGSAGQIVNFAFDQCGAGINVGNKGLANDGLKCAAGAIIPGRVPGPTAGFEALKISNTSGMARVHLSHVSIFNGVGYTRGVWIEPGSNARVSLHGCDIANFTGEGVLNQSANSIGRLIGCEFPTGGTHITNTGGSSWTETAGM